MKKYVCLALVIFMMLCLFTGCSNEKSEGSLSEFQIAEVSSLQEKVSSKQEIESTPSSETVSETLQSSSNTGVAASSESSTSTSVQVSSNNSTHEEKKEASVSESPLSNTYKLIKNEKKLTIGYIGGSITYGSSAAYTVKDGKTTQSGGDINDSWVNRVSNWFKSKYAGLKVETVNAGLSDTATNFGLFRLESTLMNPNGHDLPDLVFVEFTTNDWTYSTQSAADIELQAESLFHNIWKANPYAEIIVISTAVKADGASKAAYKKISAHYGIPFIDVGAVLQSKKEANGAGTEADGTYYYTVDNLHPSAKGYGVYFDEIKVVLEKNLDVKLQSNYLYNYKTNAKKALKSNLIDNATIIGADRIKTAGGAKAISAKLFGNMYGTGLSAAPVEIVSSYVQVTGNGGQVAAQFSGNAFGLLFGMTKEGFNIRYRIDEGEWKTFAVNADNLGWQMYDHPQVFMFEHNLSDGKHKVVISFIPNGDLGVNIRLGGILANGK